MKKATFTISLLSTLIAGSLFAQCPVGSPCYQGGGGQRYGNTWSQGQGGYESGYSPSESYPAQGGYGSYQQSPSSNYHYGHNQGYPQGQHNNVYYKNDPSTFPAPPAEHPVYPQGQQGNYNQRSYNQGNYSSSPESSWNQRSFGNYSYSESPVSNASYANDPTAVGSGTNNGSTGSGMPVGNGANRMSY